MSLSNADIIAIVTLFFTVAPLLVRLWRYYYKARQQKLAVRHASLDTESKFARWPWSKILVYEEASEAHKI